MPVTRRRFSKLFGAASIATLSSRWCAECLAISAASPDLAGDPLRPEFHLLPPHNWMNDPNGPIWWKGKYHLFYQLNPHAAVWGDMHWGHAISTDMVHWRHEPIALAPTPGGADSEGCFSGSAVVLNGVPTFVYTGVENAPPDSVTLHDSAGKLRETQMLATAEDSDLLHWKKQETPIIRTPPEGMTVTGFRDPCPWHEADGWYLGVGSGERDKGGCVLLYRSNDLRNWEYLHPLAHGKTTGRADTNPVDRGDMWECPDFFALDRQHCLFYSTEGKVIWTTGQYDAQAHLYAPEREGILDHGSYYAPKSFVAPDGRRILWGWIRETRPEAEFAAAGWSGAMALPRVLHIGKQGQLEISPAAEVESLRGSEERVTVKPDMPYRKMLATLRHEILLPVDFETGAVRVQLETEGVKVWELTVDLKGNSVRCGDLSFRLPSLPWPKPVLDIFIDGSVIESFIGGREALTSRVYAVKPNTTQLEIAVAGTKSIVLSHWELGAISPDRLTR
jgi:beta-fructofuranosidase